MSKGREDMKIIEKTPCTSGCQNFNYFLFKAYTRNKVESNTNVSMFLWLALGALKKISNSKTMGNNNNNNKNISYGIIHNGKVTKNYCIIKKQDEGKKLRNSKQSSPTDCQASRQKTPSND